MKIEQNLNSKFMKSYISKGVLAKSNAEPVLKVKEIAGLLDREAATPDEARKILFN